MNILVVDDNVSARTFVRRCLQQHPDVMVLEAGTVEEAQAECSDADLILLDWVLSGQKGADFLKPFRESGARTPVIVVSGHSNKEIVMQAAQLGANGYIRKPFTPEVLWDKILSFTGETRLVKSKRIVDYDYYFRLSKKSMEEKDYGAALHYLNKAIEMEPDLPGLYKARAELFAATGRYSEAEKDWKRAE